MSEPRPGTLDEALANGWKLLAAKPRVALAQARAILGVAPGHGDALRLAAAAHRALGEGAAALDAEMAAIAVSQKLPPLAAAAAALDTGRGGEAARIAAGFLRQSPDDLAALALLAEAAIASGVPDEAEPLLRRVIERAPTYVHARRLLRDALILLDRVTEACAMLRAMIAEGAEDECENRRMLVRYEGRLGHHEQAAADCRRLLALGGIRAEDHAAYGDTCRFLGRKDEAIRAYRDALDLDPACARAWWCLADIAPAKLTGEDLAQIGHLAAAGEGGAAAQANLHFALALVHDARREAEPAFHHFAAGNALCRESQPYDAGRLSGEVDRTLTAFAQAAMPPHGGAAGGAIPIFIIGMPRSGSTLVERMLDRHSRIEGVGELPIVPHIVQRLKRDQPEAAFEQRIAAMPADELAALGQRYLDRASEHRRTGKPFFVDKLHMNWRHVPLILRMLPQARIVDVRRDALDCCWSNYRMLFPRGHPAAADLADIGRFFRDYTRQTDALRALAPQRIHLLRYEALVDDIAGESAALFTALGLPFEEQCTDFHLSPGAVATASSEQVRRPLNRDGIGIAQAYAAWLGPLEEALREG